MKYRSRTDIAATMLEAANGGTTKTKIMYGAFLSFSQLNEYLSILTVNGLLYEVGSKYKTSAKGLRFLKTYHKMGEIMIPQETKQQPR